MCFLSTKVPNIFFATLLALRERRSNGGQEKFSLVIVRTVPPKFFAKPGQHIPVQSTSDPGNELATTQYYSPHILELQCHNLVVVEAVIKVGMVAVRKTVPRVVQKLARRSTIRP